MKMENFRGGQGGKSPQVANRRSPPQNRFSIDFGKIQRILDSPTGESGNFFQNFVKNFEKNSPMRFHVVKSHAI